MRGVVKLAPAGFVAQQQVVAVQSHWRDIIRPMRRIFRQRRGNGLKHSGFIQCQPHPQRPCPACNGIGQRLARQTIVKRQPEQFGRSRHARQMALQPDKIALPFQGLDQFQRTARRFEKTCLEQTFGIFRRFARILHHATADPQGAGLSRYSQCTDRDIEAGRLIRGKIADGAAIGAARAAFQLPQNFHRPDLGSAGDRAAGKQRLHNRGDVGIRAQPRRDGGHHGVQGRVGLDGEQIFHAYAANLRDAAHIVANEIHDHQIFGAVLCRSRQRGAAQNIIALARCGAFHGARTNMAALHFKKQFRRQAENLPCPPIL